MSRALINGRIDCKTAGRLMVDLQTVSKLLWMHCTRTKALPLIDTDNTDRRDRNLEKPILFTDPWRHPFHQDRSGVVGDHEDARESRSNAVTNGSGNAARAGIAKIVAIRSGKQAPSPFRVFQRHGFNPVLLTG